MVRHYEYFNKLGNYKGRMVVDVGHSEELFKERFPNLPFKLWIDSIKKGIDKILTYFEDRDDRFIIVNNKYNFGIQVDWRSDNKEKNNINHAYTATTLDTKTMNYYTKNDLVVFIKKLNREEKLSAERSYFRLKHIDNDMSKLGYDVFIEENKLYHTFEIIKIEA